MCQAQNVIVILQQHTTWRLILVQNALDSLNGKMHSWQIRTQSTFPRKPAMKCRPRIVFRPDTLAARVAEHEQWIEGAPEDQRKAALAIRAFLVPRRARKQTDARVSK
jgi:hypothetical protein